MSSNSKTFWAVMKLMRWENLSCEGNPIFKFQAPDNQAGYMPVFTSEEAALKFVDGNEELIREIREVPR